MISSQCGKLSHRGEQLLGYKFDSQVREETEGPQQRGSVSWSIMDRSGGITR